MIAEMLWSYLPCGSHQNNNSSLENRWQFSNQEDVNIDFRSSAVWLSLPDCYTTFLDRFLNHIRTGCFSKKYFTKRYRYFKYSSYSAYF